MSMSWVTVITSLKLGMLAPVSRPGLDADADTGPEAQAPRRTSTEQSL